jgi:uncharacterized protein with ParB-like and HNH nuclease domain
MLELFDRNSTKLTISEFYDNHEQGKYNFEVEYQRKSNVWSEDKKSFLIDSIMKNYPMPPIFVRPSIDTKTGKTKYDIVDGKQRLESIIGFIKDNVPLTDYFWEDGIFLEGPGDVEREISGKLFSEIKSDDRFSEYIKQFWVYSINIDYLYEDNIELISNIFDRLNRNGVPLNPQELRNAKYYNTGLLAAIREICISDYWKSRFDRLKNERMEDEEFISELFFLAAEDKFFDSSQDEIDRLYEKYAAYNKNEIDEIIKKFNSITSFLDNLCLDYAILKKLSWTTHLYGLFSIAWYCINQGIAATTIKDNLVALYTNYFGNNSSTYTANLVAYKASCSSRTRSKDQREKRLNAIKNYCKIT